MTRFELGQIVATPGALKAFEKSGENPALYIGRHMRGDWGDLDQEDKQLNEQALIEGTRLMSAYYLRNTGEKIYVITEHDRSVTTLLLPEEY